jgi:hypothetical protein
MTDSDGTINLDIIAAAPPGVLEGGLDHSTRAEAIAFCNDSSAQVEVARITLTDQEAAFSGAGRCLRDK